LFFAINKNIEVNKYKKLRRQRTKNYLTFSDLGYRGFVSAAPISDSRKGCPYNLRCNSRVKARFEIKKRQTSTKPVCRNFI